MKFTYAVQAAYYALMGGSAAHAPVSISAPRRPQATRRTPQATSLSPANIRARELVRKRAAAHTARMAGLPYEAGL